MPDRDMESLLDGLLINHVADDVKVIVEADDLRYHVASSSIVDARELVTIFNTVAAEIRDVCDV